MHPIQRRERRDDIAPCVRPRRFGYTRQPMRRWIILLLTVTTFVASNAWAWDSHGHNLADADPAHVISSDESAGGGVPPGAEDDHGCHGGAHCLALTATGLVFSRPIRRTPLADALASFVSLDTLPLIDPPIA